MGQRVFTASGIYFCICSKRIVYNAREVEISGRLLLLNFMVSFFSPNPFEEFTIPDGYVPGRHSLFKGSLSSVLSVQKSHE